MTTVIDRARNLGLRMRARALRYVRSRRGSVAAIIALSLVPLSGVMGLAMEGSNWMLSFRSQQNAADAAVVAAANQALQDYYLNNDSWSSSTNYKIEGAAVAKNYGYVDSTNNVTVTVAGSTSSCPSNFQNTSGFYCFKVTISKSIPLYLSRLVGYGGSGGGVQNISATAYSGAITVPAPVCFTALAHDNGSGNSYSFEDHGQSADFYGCPVGTNGGSKCSGASQGSLQLPYMVLGNDGTDKNSCAADNVTLPTSDWLTDPYVNSDTHIPTTTQCGGASLSGSTATSTLVSDATAGSTSCVLVHIISGNLTLTGNVNVTGQQIWVIQSGILNLGNYTLETGGGSSTGTGGLTIIFTGAAPTSSMGSNGYVQGSGGTFNVSSIPANTDSVGKYFGGDTLYQDPTQFGGEPPTGSTYAATFNGNSTGWTWDLSGVVYMPNADYTLNGAVDKASNGYNCFDMVVDTATINGGGSFSLFSNPLTQCGLQGSKEVQAYGYRFALVG